MIVCVPGRPTDILRHLHNPRKTRRQHDLNWMTSIVLLFPHTCYENFLYLIMSIYLFLIYWLATIMHLISVSCCTPLILYFKIKSCKDKSLFNIKTLYELPLKTYSYSCLMVSCTFTINMLKLDNLDLNQWTIK